MILESLMTGPLQVNCYLIGCEETRQAAVVDPGGNVGEILELLNEHRLTLQLVINTHGHFDHIGGNRQLLEATDAELALHEADAPLLSRAGEHAAAFGLNAEPSPAPQRLLQGGERLQLGNLVIEVIHTPGHSPGGICLRVEDHLIVGDTLFAGSIGRTDLPGGDHQQLIDSIRQQLFGLPDQLVVHPGHGPATSLGREKLHNPFLA